MKQRILATLLSLCLLVGLLPSVALAVGDELASGISGGIAWKVENSVLTISVADSPESGYDPGEMPDYARAANQENSVPWYSYLGKISNVILNDGVKNIGASAFYKAKQLTSITYQGNTNVPLKLGIAAIGGCSSLINITGLDCHRDAESGLIFDGLNSKEKVIGFSGEVESVEIPDSVTTIGLSAFNGCTTLKSINLGKVQVIEDNAFNSCLNLTTITFPNTLRTIGDWAFGGGIGLTVLELPEGITSIGTGAFGSSNLEEIILPNSIENIGNECFAYSTKLETVVLPENLQTVGKSMFYSCGALKNIKIPEGVTTIEQSAFYNCSGLEYVWLPTSLESIGNSAFFGCTALNHINIPLGVETFGTTVFNNSGTYQSPLVIYIDSKAYIEKLPTIEYEDEKVSKAITNGGTFAENTDFTSETLATPTRTGYSFQGWYTTEDFQDSTQVTNNTAEPGKTYYAKWEIETAADGMSGYCGATNEDEVYWALIKNGDTVTIDGQQEDAYTLTISGTGKMMDLEVLGVTDENTPQEQWTTDTRPWGANIYNITKVIVEEGVLNIGKRSLKCAKNLAEVNLPNGLKVIGYQAFHYCNQLKELTIPSGVNEIMQSAFEGTGIKNLVIPESVRIIGPYAFLGCSSLSSVEINNGVEQIGTQAFALTAITDIKIPDTVISLGSGTFYNCQQLEKASLPSALSEIPSQLFQFSGVKCLSLPNTLTKIGENAFLNSKLEAIFIPSSVTSIAQNAFSSLADKSVIYLATPQQSQLMTTSNFSNSKTALAVTNGGTFAEGTAFKAGQLAAPTKAEYSFQGWYTTETFQDDTKVANNVATPGQTYYAKWTKSAYSVSAKSVDFGTITYGSPVDAQTIAVSSNGGSGSVTLTAVSSNESVFTAAASGSEVTVTPKASLDVGTYSEVVTITTPDNATFSVTVTITVTKAEPSLTITPSVSSLTGGGTVTLTISGLSADLVNLSCNDSTISIIRNTNGTYSANLPNTTADYVFTAFYGGDNNHESASATCTVSVTQYTGGGGSSSSNVSGSGDDVSISASGGTVTDAQMESAVKKADEGSTITIKATSSTTVTLPVGGMADAADNDNDVLLDLRYGEVTLSARAIAGMTDGVSSNDKIKVSVANQTSSKDETISDLLDKGAAVFDVTVEVDGVEIHSFDGTLTITLTVSNLSKISDPHVLHILNNGIKEYYTPDRISGNTITVTGIRNLSTFAVIPGSEVPQTNPFTDVRTSDYYYDAVLWAADNGVTGGTSATTFSPNVTVTRAQMVTFLWRAHGSPKATGANPFTDVSTSDYYYDAVLWAVANGVTSGTSADTFGPDAAVTRAQAVTFQWRAAGSPVVSCSSFDDVAADAYYANAVAWAVANGITSGTGGSNFSPDVVVTRAQAVTFLWKELA